MDTQFLEFTDKNDRPALINVRNITSVVVYTTPNEEVHIYVIGDKESFVTVKETYEEVRNKIAMVTGGTIF
jgi:nucleoside-diphosphate-sugar epimerase